MTADKYRKPRVVPNKAFAMDMTAGKADDPRCETCRNFNPVRRRCRKYSSASPEDAYCKSRVTL